MDVKEWPPIKNPKRYDDKELFVGSVCDPYMPEEAEFRRTRTCPGSPQCSHLKR